MRLSQLSINSRPSTMSSFATSTQLFLWTAVLMVGGLAVSSCVEAVGDEDTCMYAEDGACDDPSYASATTSLCEVGTDSVDCEAVALCEDTCIWTGDGDCDDGGAGSVTSTCDLGSDCTDCGPR
jgi:hypothetical protein